MKTKTVIVCDGCDKILNPLKDTTELIAIPYEWYKTKDLFDKYDIYQCVDCKLIYRKRKSLLKFYYNKIIGFIKGLVYK